MELPEWLVGAKVQAHQSDHYLFITVPGTPADSPMRVTGTIEDWWHKLSEEIQVGIMQASLITGPIDFPVQTVAGMEVYTSTPGIIRAPNPDWSLNELLFKYVRK